MAVTTFLPTRPRSHALRMSRIHLAAAIPCTILGTLILVAAFGPAFAPYPPGQGVLGDSLLPPAWLPDGRPEHVLGTDAQGRDVLSRLLYGARLSLSLALIGTALGAAIGTAVGVLAGYLGGWFDRITLQIVELSLALPLILIALVLASLFGPGLPNVIVVTVFLLWARFARQLRSEAQVVKGQDFVNAARVAGVSNIRIILRHIFPGTINTLTVLVTLQLGTVIILESSLSFLGVGVPPDEASWGVMISGGLTQLVAGNWWLSAPPGAAISLTVLAVNLLGDWLRDALDPRLRNVQ